MPQTNPFHSVVPRKMTDEELARFSSETRETVSFLLDLNRDRTRKKKSGG